eukprot:gb/GECG01011583.1/.p1 GENE.gb/GECG01011583.1/~~gb/GECG01011583.1/.p1  ORF type:complete len:122 (+),score=2.87 gb/GECG01011583.1/:1-366(+)
MTTHSTVGGLPRASIGELNKDISYIETTAAPLTWSHRTREPLDYLEGRTILHCHCKEKHWTLHLTLRQCGSRNPDHRVVQFRLSRSDECSHLFSGKDRRFRQMLMHTFPDVPVWVERLLLL